MKFFVNDSVGIVEVPIPDKHYVKSRDSLVFMKVTITGKNNHLKFGDNVTAKKLTILIKGNNNNLIIGGNTVLAGVISIVGDNLNVFIGAHTSFQNVKMFCKGKGNGVYIGRDCMFSSDIEIRTSDAHSIISLNENRKTNHEKGIYIGDHVWLAKGCFVQKGSVIPEDNVIGFGSMVNKPLKGSNQTFAGVPVKMINENITWSRDGRENVAIASVGSWKELPYV